MTKRIIKLVLLIICMVIIFMFSSDTGEVSTKKSDGVIVRISEFFVGHHLSDAERQEKIDKYVFIIRKSAHYGIYFILGFLIMSNLIEFDKLDKTVILYYAIVFSFLYACSDEVHQLFVPGRSGKALDVLLDTFGSSCGIGFYLLWDKIVRRGKYE
ncbi:MAG: VanZ family protein [Bacilli bacterium]|nr:VanZ family protein [Bacilli bacterium]